MKVKVAYLVTPAGELRGKIERIQQNAMFIKFLPGYFAGSATIVYLYFQEPAPFPAAL